MFGTYGKTDVKFHTDGPGRFPRPAINVKCYNSLDVQFIMKEFPINLNENPDILENAWNLACEQFWEDANNLAHKIFGQDCIVIQEGRSGGWLVVDRLKHFDSWNAIDLGKWKKYEVNILKLVREYSLSNYILNIIKNHPQWWCDMISLKVYFDEVIKHWERIITGRDNCIKGKDCKFCEKFADLNNCPKCPISIYGFKCVSSEDNPWGNVSRSSNGHYIPEPNERNNKLNRAIIDMYMFLLLLKEIYFYEEK